MTRRALLVAAVLSLASASGRADDAPTQPIATADHVAMTVAGRAIAGWSIELCSGNGAVLLTDEGTFVTVGHGPDVKVVETAARPVTDVPGVALVDGLARSEEEVRDRCQELLTLRGREAQPFLDLALDSKSAEARRRALVFLSRAPLAALAGAIRRRVTDDDEDVRSSALDAYVALRRADSLKLCIDRLETDRSPLVQHTAVQQIGLLADLRGVDALLQHLANSDDRGVRIATFAALRRITRKNFGRDEDAWRAWWTNHRDEYLPDESR